MLCKKKITEHVWVTVAVKRSFRHWPISSAKETV